jgi:hypothetical protein
MCHLKAYWDYELFVCLSIQRLRNFANACLQLPSVVEFLAVPLNSWNSWEREVGRFGIEDDKRWKRRLRLCGFAQVVAFVLKKDTC